MKTRLLLLGRTYALERCFVSTCKGIYHVIVSGGKRVEVIPGKESLEKVPLKIKERGVELKKCNFRVQTLTCVCFDSAK